MSEPGPSMKSAFGINFLVAIKKISDLISHRQVDSVWQGQPEIQWNSKIVFFIVCQIVENCRIVSRFDFVLCPNREIRFLRFKTPVHSHVPETVMFAAR